MQYVVIKWNGKQDVGINKDGSEETNLELAELFLEKEADDVAAKYGGNAFPESRIFGDE